MKSIYFGSISCKLSYETKAYVETENYQLNSPNIEATKNHDDFLVCIGIADVFDLLVKYYL